MIPGKTTYKNNLLFITILGLMLLIFITIFSCDPESETHIKRVDIVPITYFFAPDSATTNDTIQLSATARIENSCWRDLFFNFYVISDSSFVLKAYGTYESFGECTSEIVQKDTIIEFSAEEKGLHKFFVYRDAYSYTVDTLIVTDPDTE
mgnify:CR=1 FL=1